MTDGPINRKFEELFAKFIGVKHAISVNSCASALELSLEAHEIKGEVILPSFTFVASANAIIQSGATPVFADVDYHTGNIDPQSIKNNLTNKTQAIMVVHYAGQCCDMQEIKKIAEEHRLIIIEDSAETIGGTYKGKKSGNFGTGCFSFFPTKNFTTGEGGMVTTNNDDIAYRVRALAAHGIPREIEKSSDQKNIQLPWKREAFFYGHNHRMSSILAAIGIIQLEKAVSMNEKRRMHASFLNNSLSKNFFDLPLELTGNQHVYQMYTIKVKNAEKRNSFVMNLREKGIGASVHFDPPVHLHHIYKKYIRENRLIVTGELSNKSVTLPMYPGLTTEQLLYMTKTINEVAEKILI
jgi:perosamine synthetase